MFAWLMFDLISTVSSRDISKGGPVLLRIAVIVCAMNCCVIADETLIHVVDLPSLPDTPGVATPFAGIVDGDLIVAGGANFPDAPPWKGGRKVWHDSIYRLHGQNWEVTGRLQRPLAYGVSIQTPKGLLCVGGSDAERHYADAFWLAAESDRICQKAIPSLPMPVANACGAMVGDTVIVAGGTARPDATAALNHVFAANLREQPIRWRSLPGIPGAGRILSVAAGTSEDFYLFSGASLERGMDGQAKRTYLRECLRFNLRSEQWTQLPDMPVATVAAPSPAAVIDTNRIVILGGDDGSAVGFQPPEEHPGFRSQALILNTRSLTWSEADLPVSRVTVPLVHDGKRYIIPSGEMKPGVRSPAVFEFHFHGN